MKVTVFQTLQSSDNEPVEIVWSRNGTPLDAAACVARILADTQDPDTNVPPCVRPRTLSIRVVLHDEPTLQLHMTETRSTPNFKKFGNPDEFYVVCRCGWHSRDSFPLSETQDEARAIGDLHLKENNS